jgi:hypothetical protein
VGRRQRAAPRCVLPWPVLLMLPCRAGLPLLHGTGERPRDSNAESACGSTGSCLVTHLHPCSTLLTAHACIHQGNRNLCRRWCCTAPMQQPPAHHISSPAPPSALQAAICCPLPVPYAVHVAAVGRWHLIAAWGAMRASWALLPGSHCHQSSSPRCWDLPPTPTPVLCR